MLRSIFFNFLFYFTIFFFGILFIPSLASKKLTRAAVRFWAKLIIYFLKVIIGVRVLFRNKYINNNKGYLIAANHQSTFDTIFFLNQFDKVIYVVKKELMYIPIYGWYAMRLGNIFIDRKERISAIKHLSYKVSAALKENYKIIIFPEGTRQEKNIIGNMKSGIYAIYKSCKCPIYPIYIGSYVVWPKNSYIKSKNDIKVKTLKPIRSNDTKINFLSRLKDDLEKEHIKKY